MPLWSRAGSASWVTASEAVATDARGIMEKRDLVRIGLSKTDMGTESGANSDHPTRRFGQPLAGRAFPLSQVRA